MTSIEEKIRLYGQNQDFKALQNYIKNVDIAELLKTVENKINNANFTSTWDYLLQGFTTDSASQSRKFLVVEAVLKALENNVMMGSHYNSIIHRLSIELINFNTEQLICLCNFYVNGIQAQRVFHMSWKELLPEILNILVEKEQLEYNGVYITGSEYKHKLIEALCLLQWSPNIVVSLSSMFIEIPLTKEEHFQVVTKLGQYLQKLTPQEVPPFVYQLLRLCKCHNFQLIFMKLQNYFNVRVYSNINSKSTETNSESTNYDVIENVNMQEAVEAESTVLYHIYSSASLGHDCIKEFLTSLSKLLKSPEFILHPFQLGVLLTISTIKCHEEKVFEIIRSSVARIYHEEQKKNNSAWFRDMVPSAPKVEAVFSQVIDLSAQDRDLLLQGLVNFAFVLLGVGSALGRDVVAEKQWELGSIILFKVIKRKRHTASTIVKKLSNCIITGDNITQYVECFYMMTKNLSLLMIENKSIIVNLIEQLMKMPGNNGNQLIDPIIPLIKVSPTIRDHFIILLRKALYSRSMETRQMALNGFLKLLSNLKISASLSITQSTFSGSFSSGHSLCTQISMSRATQYVPSVFSNEALCLQILCILRRCFTQQPEIRCQLYEGLYDAICVNPELEIAVLDLLLLHCSEFYNVDDEVLPPIKFDTISLTRDVTVALQEPIGKLIYILGLIAAKAHHSNEDNSTVQKAVKMMDSLCRRMTSCELVHLELDDGTDLLDIMPESQQKIIVLKESISVYEALIGYKFCSWNKDSENYATQIMGLFQGYQRLLHFSKNISKGKKKKIDNDATNQHNTTVKKDGQKNAKNFKSGDTVLDFRVMNKIMALLHEPVLVWARNAEANIIKSKKEFHQQMLHNLLNILASIKNKKFIEFQFAKMTYSSITEISILLFERVIRRLTEYMEFDSISAIIALECFYVIFNIVSSHFKTNFSSFLSAVGGKDKENDISTHLSGFIETYEKIFEIEHQDILEDIEMKKMHLIAINTLNFLSSHIPATNNFLSLKLYEWLKNYALNNEISNQTVCMTFVNLLFHTNVKYKMGLTLIESFSLCIGDVTGVINQDEHNQEKFKVITDLTVNNVLLSLCNTVKYSLENIDWVIVRLKSEFRVLTFSGETNVEKRKDVIKAKEKGVCCQLIFLVTIMTNVSNCTVPSGNLSEAILKNLVHLYSSLSSFTKYFMLRSSKTDPVFQAAKFERLVKLAGKQLAPVIYQLILYIEESQKQDGQPRPQNSKRKIDTSTLKSKVLKETRLIPKVIYEIEQFSKCVIQLSNKTKVDFSTCIGQGTVRDFRIQKLKEVIEQVTEAPPTTQNTQENDESALENADSNADSDEEVSTLPPSKKSKR